MKEKVALLFLFLFMYIHIIHGQQDGCPIIKVAVEKGEMADGFMQKVIKDNPGEPESEDHWLSVIQEMVLEALRINNPSVLFTKAGSGESYEYVFTYTLMLDEIAEEDYDFVESIVDPLSTLYYRMSSNLSSVNPCGPGMYTGPHVITKSRNLKVVIEANVADYFSIDKRLKEYEKEHPVPPRAPEMTVELEPDYVSPLEGERTLRIKANIINCEGNPVYSKLRDQYVYFSPLKSDRGELYGGMHGSLMGAGSESNTLVVFTKADGKAETEFRLQEGLGEEILQVSITTCGLVSFFIKELESIKIKGLEIKVRPTLKEIFQDEETDIILTLNKTDPEGDDEPVPGKRLSVNIAGLVNGEMKPVSGYVTDSRGEVRLHYKAGDKDERITITASFQPAGYPDKAVGTGTITVKPPEYDALVTITGTKTREIHTENHDSRTDKDGCTTKNDEIRKINESINSTITIRCKLSHVADMPVYNQKWEYYQPVSANLSGFNLDHREVHQIYGSVTGSGCASGGSETTISTKYTVVDPHINEPSVGMWILAIDNNTNKAVKFIPGGFSVEYDLDIISALSSKQWGSGENDSKDETDTKRSEHNLFKVGPVEDPEPDPTYKPGLSGLYDYLRKEVGDSVLAAIPAIPIPPSSSEKVPEINPDLLVQFGDGVNSFGGSGTRDIDKPLENGYDREKLTYNWQMTRRKLKR